MTTTDHAFPIAEGLEALLAGVRSDSIDLTEQDMKKGRRIRDQVKAAVAALSDASRVPILLRGESFSVGSFGRLTQAKPLDDIDIFFPVDAASVRLESPANTPTGEQLVSRSDAGAIGCRTDLHTGPWLDSGKTLDQVVTGLAEIALPARDVGKNPRGRCAHLTLDGVNVDLVFVLWSRVPQGLDRYHLPSGAGPTWRTANPKDDQRRLSDANQNQHGGLLLPTIRALKAWNDHTCGGRLKSIHLEVLAVQTVFARTQITSVVSALTYAFHNLRAALAGPCSDPTGLGPNLDSNLHQEDRDWVIDQAARSANDSAIANALAPTDFAAATAQWERILLTETSPPPERGHDGPQPGRHDDEFGQPAHHCEQTATFVVPPARSEDRAPRAIDQRGRRGEYA